MGNILMRLKRPLHIEDEKNGFFQDGRNANLVTRLDNSDGCKNKVNQAISELHALLVHLLESSLPQHSHCYHNLKAVLSKCEQQMHRHHVQFSGVRQRSLQDHLHEDWFLPYCEWQDTTDFWPPLPSIPPPQRYYPRSPHTSSTAATSANAQLTSQCCCSETCSVLSSYPSMSKLRRCCSKSSSPTLVAKATSPCCSSKTCVLSQCCYSPTAESSSSQTPRCFYKSSLSPVSVSVSQCYSHSYSASRCCFSCTSQFRVLPSCNCVVPKLRFSDSASYSKCSSNELQCFHYDDASSIVQSNHRRICGILSPFSLSQICFCFHSSNSPSNRSKTCDKQRSVVGVPLLTIPNLFSTDYLPDYVCEGNYRSYCHDNSRNETEDIAFPPTHLIAPTLSNVYCDRTDKNPFIKGTNKCSSYSELTFLSKVVTNLVLNKSKTQGCDSKTYMDYTNLNTILIEPLRNIKNSSSLQRIIYPLNDILKTNSSYNIGLTSDCFGLLNKLFPLSHFQFKNLNCLYTCFDRSLYNLSFQFPNFELNLHNSLQTLIITGDNVNNKAVPHCCTCSCSLCSLGDDFPICASNNCNKTHQNLGISYIKCKPHFISNLNRTTCEVVDDFSVCNTFHLGCKTQDDLSTYEVPCSSCQRSTPACDSCKGNNSDAQDSTFIRRRWSPTSYLAYPCLHSYNCVTKQQLIVTLLEPLASLVQHEHTQEELCCTGVVTLLGRLLREETSSSEVLELAARALANIATTQAGVRAVSAAEDDVFSTLEKLLNHSNFGVQLAATRALLNSRSRHLRPKSPAHHNEATGNEFSSEFHDDPVYVEGIYPVIFSSRDETSDVEQSLSDLEEDASDVAISFIYNRNGSECSLLTSDKQNNLVVNSVNGQSTETINKPSPSEEVSDIETRNLLLIRAKPNNIKKSSRNEQNTEGGQKVSLPTDIKTQSDINVSKSAMLANPDVKLKINDHLYSDSDVDFEPKKEVSSQWSDATEADVDVVLVHGVLGGAAWTWRQNDKLRKQDSGSNMYSWCWPRDWLAADVSAHTGKKMRVIAVNYPDSWNQDAQAGLLERGQALHGALSAAGVGRRPVLWVAHSMGGLLVKAVLLHSEKDSHAKSSDSLVDQTLGIVFLSTPHLGSPLAPIMATMYPHLAHLSALRPGNPELATLQEEFVKQQSRGAGFAVLNVIDAKPHRVMGLSVTLVPALSADAGVGEVVSIDATHLDICKPINRSSPVYKTLLEFVLKTLQQSSSKKHQ